MKLKIFLLLLLIFTFSSGILPAQKKSKKITVSGFVTDSNFRPVEGALILVDQQSTQVFTGENGYYRIRIRPDALVISVLTPNKETMSQLIDNQESINFPIGVISSETTLQTKAENNKLLDLGYKKVDPEKMAVSVSNSDVIDASGDEFSIYHDIYEMIKGRVPGVDVNGQKIRVRGVTSFNSNNDPLFVVDGIPVNSIENIMPNMVQSITLLKGTSTAFYGSRGAYGVIVITLKKNSSIKK